MKPVLPILALASAASLHAGPYSAGSDDPGNAYDAPVPGFTGPDGTGGPRLYLGTDENFEPIYQNENNYNNPIFFGWAKSVTSFQQTELAFTFSDPTYALGPAYGDHFDVVSLGDLSPSSILNGDPPGSITLELDSPVSNLSGADFVVFENAAFLGTGLFAELAYVEVSPNGTDFTRFPSTSLNDDPVGPYSPLDPTNVHNLAGKHANNTNTSWGTPFDLDDVGLSQITHIRIIDIPGSGDFSDHLGNPIYDPFWSTDPDTSTWPSFSGGFDLEAIGTISVPTTFDEWPLLTPPDEWPANWQLPWPLIESLDAADREPDADPDNDGLNNLLEYAFARIPWQPDSGNTPSCQLVDGTPAFRFVRDERITDLSYEVQFATNLSGPWTTIASSTAGAPTAPAAGHNPAISETSASDIASIGVIRQVTVTPPSETSGHGFFRVLVTRLSP